MILHHLQGLPVLLCTCSPAEPTCQSPVAPSAHNRLFLPATVRASCRLMVDWESPTLDCGFRAPSWWPWLLDSEPGLCEGQQEMVGGWGGRTQREALGSGKMTDGSMCGAENTFPHSHPSWGRAQKPESRPREPPWAWGLWGGGGGGLFQPLSHTCLVLLLPFPLGSSLVVPGTPLQPEVS